VQCKTQVLSLEAMHSYLPAAECPHARVKFLQERQSGHRPETHCHIVSNILSSEREYGKMIMHVKVEDVI